jgi:peptide subunit release factor 1 (eRF1)
MTWKHHVKSLNTLLKLEPELERADGRTLSLYLPVRAGGFEAKHYNLLIEHVVDDYRRDLDEKLRPTFDAEVQRVRTHLNMRRPAGCPALVAFSNQGTGLLTLIRLPETVEARVEVGEILLAPLELVLERHAPAIVVVLDKEDARVLASVLGEVVQLDQFAGQEVKHIRAGGPSAPSNQRKADNRARANVKQVVAVLDREVTRGGFTRIVVAGPDEARAFLMHELPKQLAEIVSGTISASLVGTRGQISEHVREQLARADQAAPAGVNRNQP